MSDVAGRPLGSQYLLGDRIGRGGMGEVWRGTDRRGNPVAVKLLHPQCAQDANILHRFISERQLVTSVTHPNIVRVHDMVVEGPNLAIVMELVEGTDLRAHLNELGTLDPAEACRLAAEMARGLAAIHAHQIVHRDIKPENVLLDKRTYPPRVKLTDFGVAKLLAESPQQATATVLAGTPLYMAPEIINGQIPGPQVDLYALGIVLYEMLCGVTPFTGLAAGPVLQAHLAMVPGRPAGIADPIWNLIGALTDKDPSRRPWNAEVVAGHLEGLATHTMGQGPLPRLAVPPPGITTPPTVLGPVGATAVADPRVAPPLARWQTPTTLGTQGAPFGPTPAGGDAWSATSPARPAVGQERSRGRGLLFPLAVVLAGVLIAAAVLLRPWAWDRSVNDAPSAAASISPSPTVAVSTPPAVPAPVMTTPPPTAAAPSEGAVGPGVSTTTQPRTQPTSAQATSTQVTVAGYGPMASVAAADQPWVEANLLDRWTAQLEAVAMRDGATQQQTYRQLSARYQNLRVVSSNGYASFKTPDYWVFVSGQVFPTGDAANAWCAQRSLPVASCFARRLSYSGTNETNAKSRGA